MTHNSVDTLISSIAARVPAGSWAVGVSGGADSVALLLLLNAIGQSRGDLFLHVAHLDHQTRGDESTGDARFVASLSASLGVTCTIARRDEIEPDLGDLPANPSARYRAIRHALFRRVVAAENLRGVVLAHHADDQAETVLHRLNRGSAMAGLAGMSPATELAGLTILRPLLVVPRDALRLFLNERGQGWREDASNASDHYLRNRLRRLLARHPQLTAPLIALANNCAAARDWSRRSAPTLPEEFAVAQLQRLPALLALESARQWLLARGVPPQDVARSPDAAARLVAMACDAASANRVQFPGGINVRRRRGAIGKC